MNLYIFYSIISISIALFFLLISIMIFFINDLFKKQEIKNKKKFNNLDITDFKSKIETISSISNFNSNFESLLNVSFEFQEEYKNKLMIVKEDLLTLTELNENFNIIESSKLNRKIWNDLKNINDSLILHDEKIDLSKKLYESISDLLIEYIKLSKDILFFYEKHIMIKYDNNYILSKINNLNDKLNKLSEMKKSFEIYYFFSCVSEINEILEEIISMCKMWYVMDRICLYINTNISNIESKLIHESKTIRNIDSINVEKKLSIIKNKHMNIQNELKFASFEIVQADVKECILAIQDINSNINYTIKTDLFYSEYLNYIKNYLSKIKDENNNIKDILNQINDNFLGNEKINKQLNSIIKIMDNLTHQHKVIKYDLNKKKLPIEKYIKFIMDTIHLLYTWIISLDSLVKSLEDRYSNFSYSIKEILNFKFSIGKIIGSIYEYNIMNESIIEKLENHFNFISNIEDEINQNYKKSFDNRLSDILIDKKVELIELKSYVEKEIKLKFFSEKLLIYANKFLLEDELFKNKIIIAENFYFNKNYKKTLEYLLKEIRKFH